MQSQDLNLDLSDTKSHFLSTLAPCMQELTMGANFRVMFKGHVG